MRQKKLPRLKNNFLVIEKFGAAHFVRRFFICEKIDRVTVAKGSDRHEFLCYQKAHNVYYV